MQSEAEAVRAAESCVLADAERHMDERDGSGYGPCDWPEWDGPYEVDDEEEGW